VRNQPHSVRVQPISMPQAILDYCVDRRLNLPDIVGPSNRLLHGRPPPKEQGHNSSRRAARPGGGLIVSQRSLTCDAAPESAQGQAGCNQNSKCAISLTRSGFNLYPCHRLFSIIASIDGSTSPTSLASFFILFRHRRTRRRRTSSDPQLWCATSLTRSGFNLYPCHRLFSITASIDGSTSPTSLGRRTGCYTGGLRQKNKGITRPEERPDPVAD
jgi:hypothetical protein